MELPWSSPGFVNVYFIEEKDGYVMIDCGVNGSEYQELLETKMKSFGLSYENIKLLIGTHMHSDHIGLSSTLREKDIPFALYKNSVEFIEGYNDWSIRFKKLKEYAKKEGAPKSFLDDIDQIGGGVKLVIGETFVDSDANLMTAGAIDDRIDTKKMRLI